MQQGQSHPYSDMETYKVTTCHNDGLGIVVPISDIWYNMYMLPVCAIVKKSSNIIKLSLRMNLFWQILAYINPKDNFLAYINIHPYIMLNIA